jgi:hypothetical protein
MKRNRDDVTAPARSEELLAHIESKRLHAVAIREKKESERLRLATHVDPAAEREPTACSGQKCIRRGWNDVMIKGGEPRVLNNRFLNNNYSIGLPCK